MTDRDQRVREIAYFLWLDEGCPEGESERHWLAAERVVGPEPAETERAEDGASDEPKRRSRSQPATSGSE